MPAAVQWQSKPVSGKTWLVQRAPLSPSAWHATVPPAAHASCAARQRKDIPQLHEGTDAHEGDSGRPTHLCMRACWPEYCPRQIPRSTCTCTVPDCWERCSWATRLRTLPLSPRRHCTGLWRIHRYLHSHRDRFSQVAHPATVGARAHHSIHVQFVRLLGDSTPRSFRQICTSRQPRCSLLRTEIDTGRRGGLRST